MNASVALLLGRHSHDHHREIPKKTKKSTRESVNKELTEGVSGGPPCCSSDPVKQLNGFQRMASVIEHEIEDAAKDAAQEVIGEGINEDQQQQDDEKKIVEEISDVENIATAQVVNNNINNNGATTEVVDNESPGNNDEAERLHKMGLNTAIAIGLHNFPEGTYG